MKLSRRCVRRVLALSMLGVLAGCSRDNPVVLRVVSADGGDPFGPPDGATQARIRVEDGVTAPRTFDVSPGGAFSLDVTPARPDLASRIVLEALVAGAVVGSGATPPVSWQALGGAVVPIFVQRRDSLVMAPSALEQARVAPVLVPVAGTFVAVLGGVAGRVPIDVYDLTMQRAVQGAATLDEGTMAGASVVPLASGRLLVVRGCTALLWDPGTNVLSMPAAMPPSERCGIEGSTALWEPVAQGGGLLMGGRDASGPVARVDLVAADGTWQTAARLAVPREGPSAARTGPFAALVAGGQAGTTGFLERYASTAGGTRVEDPRVDGRTGATLVAAGDGVVLALGGQVAGNTDLVADDVVLDTRCLETGCPLVASLVRLMQVRRTGALAALAEGGRVLVLAGTTVGGLASQVELVDVSVPRAPQGAGIIGDMALPGLSVLSLVTGSVLVAGGGRREVWLYRH